MTSILRAPVRNLTAIAAALGLAACGGGGSSSAAAPPAPVATAPAPAPTPTPAPAPVPPPFTFERSPFLLQQSAPISFAVLGYSFRSASGGFDNIADPASIDGSTPLGLRLVSRSDVRFALMNVEGQAMPNGGGGVGVDGQITQLGFNALQGAGSFSLLLGPAGRALTSTALLYWSRVDRPADAYPMQEVILVYGVPTPASEVPGSGVVRYGGSAAQDTVAVDFGAGTVTGSFVADNGSVVTLRGVLSADRGGFTGPVTSADGQIDTTLEARFTGPGAAEIMYRWVHPLGSRRPARVGGLIRIG